MTRVSFYSNLENKSDYCVFLAKQAFVKKHMVTILVDNENVAQELSLIIWSKDSEGFLPNALACEPHALQTPVIFDWPENRMNHEIDLFQDDILINLTQQQPSHFSRYRTLVELVGLEEVEKVAARQRYKYYRDCGYEVKHQDAQKIEQ